MIALFVLISMVFIFLQAFFAASELAAISSHMISLHNRKLKGERGARYAYTLITDPEKFLATTLVGINVSLVISSSCITYALMYARVADAHFWTTIIFTPVVIIFAELIPKNIGRHSRENFMCAAAGVNMFFARILAPLVRAIEHMSRFVVRICIGKVRARSLFVTKEEVVALVNEVESSGGIDQGEGEAINWVFAFKHTALEGKFLPWKRVSTVEYSEPYHALAEKARVRAFTRYPVFKEGAVAGYINVYDVFYCGCTQWQKFIRPVMRIDASSSLYEAFRRLKANKESMAIVFRDKEPVGMIALQDIVREIMRLMVRTDARENAA